MTDEPSPGAPRLLFVTAGRFFPEARRGAARSAAALLRRLARRRWSVVALCATARDARARPATGDFLPDHDLGFPCWRGLDDDGPRGGSNARERQRWWFERLRERFQGLLRDSRPDVVVGQLAGVAGLLADASRLGFPTVFLDRHMEEQPLPLAVQRIANSPIVAAWLHRTGHPQAGVVLPIIDIDDYRVAERQRRFVTFINPIPDKGLALAVRIAALMPEARFLFVRVRSALGVVEAGDFAGGNVTVRDEAEDVRDVYRQTDILIHPSQWDEPFGRVIIEAQANGIPVVASDAGGIPFTVGGGGLIIPRREGADAYVATLRRLRADPDLYRRISTLAVDNARRPEFDPERQVDVFERLVRAGLRRDATATATA